MPDEGHLSRERRHVKKRQPLWRYRTYVLYRQWHHPYPAFIGGEDG